MGFFPSEQHALAKSVQNDMCGVGFHLTVPSSALWWAPGGVGFAARQISPAFGQRRSGGDARSRLEGLQ